MQKVRECEAANAAADANSYNERLFEAGGLRSFYHLARFKWVADTVRKLKLHDLRLVELGCFDGRLFEEIVWAVEEYVGLDANWEGGLALAREKFRNNPSVRLIEAVDPSPLRQFGDGHFTAAASLETIEHIPPQMVDGYLDELARVTDGHFFVTVPNEIGPIFLTKHIAKRILYGDGDGYTLREVAASTLLRPDLVERSEHKGFDYRAIVREISRRFEVVSVEGLASFGLPAIFSPTVAILARSKKK